MRTPFIALAAVALVAGVPAAAKDFVVVHQDLDLSTAQGQKALKKRIDAEARAYCGMDRLRTGSRLRDKGALTCYKDAKAAAGEQFAALIDQSRKGG